MNIKLIHSVDVKAHEVDDLQRALTDTDMRVLGVKLREPTVDDVLALLGELERRNIYLAKLAPEK